VQLYKVAGRKQVALGQQVCSLAALLPHSLMLGYDFHFFNYEPLLKVRQKDSILFPLSFFFFFLIPSLKCEVRFGKGVCW